VTTALRFFATDNLPKCTVKVLYDIAGNGALQFVKNSLNSFTKGNGDKKLFVPTKFFGYVI